MTSDDRFGGTVSVWLEERAGTGAPDYLDDILGRTARTRQRPGWTSIERWPPMDISANRTALPSRFPTRSLGLLAIIGLLLAALVAAALLAAGSRPRLPAPFGPAADGSMVYEDAGDIHVAATDGTSRVLVAGPTNDFSPWFSNDGTKFAFLREEGDELFRLMVADSEGGNVRSLLGEPLYQPDWWTWSPDGSQLVGLPHSG